MAKKPNLSGWQKQTRQDSSWTQGGKHLKEVARVHAMSDEQRQAILEGIRVKMNVFSGNHNG